jgi:DNA-3-methyladenine glycosylase
MSFNNRDIFTPKFKPHFCKLTLKLLWKDNYMKKEEILTRGWTKLPADFYERSDVVFIAKELIGKILVSTFGGYLTAGRIVETEAYNGIYDKASHAYGNRRTNRTEIMYAHGGVAYVYLCYGIHHLFNVVTNVKDNPGAVLIRALDPIAGKDKMLERSKKEKVGYDLTRGPGNVSKSLGIFTKHTGADLLGDELFIVDDGFKFEEKDILTTARIGVDYAAEDALLPYRFIVRGNMNVSGKKTLNRGFLKLKQEGI